MTTTTTRKAWDKYDESIAYLKKHPTEIMRAWNMPLVRSGGALFTMTGLTGTFCDSTKRGGSYCGCLTQVKAKKCPAYTPRLTKLIRADKRIPDSPEKVTVRHLKAFADWQRRLDKELGRKP